MKLVMEDFFKKKGKKEKFRMRICSKVMLVPSKIFSPLVAVDEYIY